MNALVFNTAADQLQTSIFGLDSGTYRAIKVNSSGEMYIATSSAISIAGTVTVGNSVTIANTSLTVAGTVTVGNSVTIANTSLTVAGTVTVGNSVTIANTSLTVLVSGNNFSSSVSNLANVTGTGFVFDDTNISQLRTATMFVNNTGANPITVTLQLSPDGTTYFDDPRNSNIIITGTEKKLIVVDTFAQFMRLEYILNTVSATFDAYYNAQA